MTGVRAAELSDVRAGVVMTVLSGTHVVALHNDDNGGFHVYDNDSQDRMRGTSSQLRGDEVKDRYEDVVLIAIMQETSPLSLRLGGPITTLVHRWRRAREGHTEASPPPRRRRQIQITSFLGNHPP